MTVQEARYKYGVRAVEASVGDTITKIVRRLYDSDDKKYIIILKTLNLRFDWSSIKPGDRIYYLSKQVAEKIQEV